MSLIAIQVDFVGFFDFNSKIIIILQKKYLLNWPARNERLRMTPLRVTTTQYSSPQHTAVLRIHRRTARSAAEFVERTAAQHWFEVYTWLQCAAANNSLKEVNL